MRLCRLLFIIVLPVVLPALALGHGPARELPFPDRVEDISSGWRRAGQIGTPQFAIERPDPRAPAIAVIAAGATPARGAWTIEAAVRPCARYRVSARVRTVGIEGPAGAGAGLALKGRSETSTWLTGTEDWRDLALEIDTGNSDTVQIEAVLGGAAPVRGRAEFSRARIEPVEERPLAIGRVDIDAALASPPLDVRIYSQFIEHLGRCIDGGLWAEMLADRKFLHPIQPQFAPYGPGVARSASNPYPILRASPWHIADGTNGVTMVTNDVFSARHVPRLAPGAAIRQGDLAVERGRRYIGHVRARAESRGGRLTVTLDGAAGGLSGAAVPTRDYGRLSFQFTATNTSDTAALTLRVDGAAARIGAVSLMPADNIEGLRADTLALVRELRAPIYRWPGGNFASGYDWRDGIGERDRRPPRPNPAWAGIEPNDVGLHEFVRFCRLVGAEPLITVNTGFGDAHSAAALLEYCNGDTRTTHWGRRRAENGAREPFNVRYWCIGNEMFGAWQLGHMRLEHYQIKHNWVVDTMRAVDPHIIAIGSGNAGPWSEGLLRHCADRMDWIAEHFYCSTRPRPMSHIRQITDAIRRKADAHRGYRHTIPGLADRDIAIAMTEWNYWYGPHVFGDLGTRYFLRDALGIAAGFHEYARQSDIIRSAFYAQTVNVIGAIKTSRTRAAFETTSLALKMYRGHFLGTPLGTATGPLLDAQALRSPDGGHLVLGVVNPWPEPVEVPWVVTAAAVAGPGRVSWLGGADPMAFNDPDRPPAVLIEAADGIDPTAPLRLPPCSASIYVFPLRASASP